MVWRLFRKFALAIECVIIVRVEEEDWFTLAIEKIYIIVSCLS